MLAIAFVIASSCSKEQVGDSYMLFEIFGTVTDQDGNPLEGIQVSSGFSETQSTNKNGSFSFYGRSTPTKYVMLTFQDVDGAEKGGLFINRALEVLVQEKTPGSEMGNFRGTYFASGVEVVMEKKECEMNPDDGFVPLNASAELKPEEER